MSPLLAPPLRRHRLPWQEELATAVRDPFELCQLLDLDERVAREAVAAAGDFPLLVPRGFVARMRRGDPADPLLLQVLPRASERVDVQGFVPDPLGELDARGGPGLIRKYRGRVLLLATGGCSVNCRYCFRRAFPYATSGVTSAGLRSAVAAISADETIHEVILSGGDPLLLDDEQIGGLIGMLADIPHVRRLRVHSRMPVVLPARVTERLLHLLGSTRLASSLVMHVNHPAEIDDEVAEAAGRLAVGRVLLFNQSVLLAGINDDAEVLVTLSERLIDIGVVPYYLHLLDRVTGTAAFEVAESRALAIHAELTARLSGYAVPRLVREEAGRPAKVRVA
jgi:EF-P beta-lysylation protein EpmB